MDHDFSDLVMRLRVQQSGVQQRISKLEERVERAEKGGMFSGRLEPALTRLLGRHMRIMQIGSAQVAPKLPEPPEAKPKKIRNFKDILRETD